MTEVNKYLLKITGSAELEQELNAKKDVFLNMPIAIYSCEYSDQQDGTVNIIYKSKVCGAIEARQGDVKIKGKDPSKMSQKMRSRIRWFGEGFVVADTEGYYEAMIKELMKDKYIEEAHAKINLEKYR